MARGKPNRIMLGVLGVAVLALVTDQLLPAESAASVEQASVDATANAEADGSDSRPTRAGPTLSDRFGAFESTQPIDINKAFAPLEPASEPVAESEPSAETPEAGVKLSAILRREDGNIAVINGRPLREGQSVDGFEVVSIGASHVDIRTSVGAITLHLERPSLQAD
jgi:hypothetical protein